MSRLAGASAFLYLVTQAIGQEHELYRHLMQNYVKEIRPVRNYEDVVHVVLHPTLEFLVEVEELHESLTALFWFSMFWNDDFLVWNATEFGGIDKLHLPATAIWRPDLIVYGAVKTEFALPLEDTVAVVQSNGRVAVELAQVVQMFCVFDIELFPFDKQNCTMEFGSWTYSLDRVAFAPLKDNGSTEFLRDQLEWEIISFESNLLEGVYELGDSFKNETFDELYYHFVFKRKPTFYIIYLVIPSFLITLLSVIGLFAPFSSSGERQEKVTLGLTSLFAMALILDIVSKEIPKTSKGIPLLGRFVLYELIIIALAVLTAVVIISFHKATVLRKEPPPRWLLRFLLLKQADAKRRTSWFNHNLEAFEPDYVKEDIKSIGAFDRNVKVFASRSLQAQGLLGRLLTDLSSCRAHLHTIASASQLKLQNRHTRELWIRIFDRLDQCCLLLYSLGNLIMTLVLLIHY